MDRLTHKQCDVFINANVKILEVDWMCICLAICMYSVYLSCQWLIPRGSHQVLAS